MPVDEATTMKMHSKVRWGNVAEVEGLLKIEGTADCQVSEEAEGGGGRGCSSREWAWGNGEQGVRREIGDRRWGVLWFAEAPSSGSEASPRVRCEGSCGYGRTCGWVVRRAMFLERDLQLKMASRGAGGAEGGDRRREMLLGRSGCSAGADCQRYTARGSFLRSCGYARRGAG